MTSGVGWLAGLDDDDDGSDPDTVRAFEAYMADRPPEVIDDAPPADPFPHPDEQYEADLAWRVRNLELADKAKAIYKARTTDASIPEALDVAAVLRGEVDPLVPTMLTRTDRACLIYPGLLHWLYGPPTVGKTMVAVCASFQLLARGGHVGYLDWEGNRQVVGDRLKGLDPDVVAERFHYYRPGNLEPHRGWLAEKAANEWHLCIFDGTAKALAASGRDEERNPELLAWMEQVITPITEAGCAVLMLDHVTKDPENRGMPRGAGAKLGEVSGAAWEVRAGQPFNRRRAGYLRLIQRKDREGRTGIDGECVAELHVLPSRDRTRLELRPPAANAADQARYKAMENVWKAVDARNTAEHEAPSTTKVWKIVGGDRANLSDLLNELADLGHLRVIRGGAGRSTTWEPVTPYLAPALDPAPSPLSLPAEAWDVLGGE